MLDLLIKSPVRAGVLGSLLAALVAGKCGEIRPSYMGSGGLGATITPVIAPAYAGHDTATTTVTVLTGHGQTFNPGDANSLTSASISRSWARPDMGWEVGAVGYQGRYTLSPMYFGSGRPLSYAGVGATAQFNYHVRAGRIEIRPVTFRVGVAREWGQWPDFRARAPASFNRPRPHDSLSYDVVPISQQGDYYLQGLARLGGEFVTIPRRRWAPVFGLSLGVALSQGHFGPDARILLGAGPLRLHALILGIGTDEGATRQLGLSVALPPYR